MRKLLQPRTIFPAVALGLLAAVFLVPRISVDRLAQPVRARLERAIDRRVEFSGPLHLRLLPAPGFSTTNVVIYDDPSFGVEPIAYVSSLEFELRPLALLAGRLEFSTLRLTRPSVNLTKNAGGNWNYLSLLERTLHPAPPGAATFPHIEVRSGRLNFKFGARKSVFYLRDADIDAGPAEDGGGLSFRFEGEPSRTDRAAQGFGHLLAIGKLGFSGAAVAGVHVVVRLERSAIGELVTLVQGRGGRFGGFVASRAELDGPVSNIRIRGRLELAEVDRRFLLPSRKNLAVDYEGSLDLPGQQLLLESRPGSSGPLPFTVRLLLRDYLSATRWGIGLNAVKLPLASVPPFLREMGINLPKQIAVGGTASGALSWSSARGVQGRFRVAGFAFGRRGAPPLRLGDALFTLWGTRVELQPVTLRLGPQGTARLTLVPAGDHADLEIDARRLPVAGFRDLWRQFPDAPLPESVKMWSGGLWSGSLRRPLVADGSWSGVTEISGTQLKIDGLAEPLELESVRTGASARRFSFRGRAAGGPFTGTLRRSSGRNTPDTLQLVVPVLDAGALESLLSPTLGWRQGGFLARTFQIEDNPPGWLLRRRLEILFRVDLLRAGPTTLTGVSGKLFWNGTRVEAVVEKAHGGAATLDGRLRMDLAGGRPDYRLAARIHGFQWAGGLLNVEGRMQAAGSGLALLNSAVAEGEFSATGLHGPSGVPLDIGPSCYEFRVRRGLPELHFSCLELKSRGSVYHGWGQMQPSGRLDLALFNGDRRYRATGAQHPFRLAIREAEAGTLEWSFEGVRH